MLSPHGLEQRSRFLQAVRNFFLSREYLEVDTPLRLPVLIPEAEIVPIRSEERFLHTSPELCMKRLLANGASRLFQICHCFRKGERGRLHQEEFTLLEWYHTGWSYDELMTECEVLVLDVVQQSSLTRDGKEISLALPWQRMSVAEAFCKYGGIEVQQAIEAGIFDQVLVERIEPCLGWARPLFLYDYPIALASLARPRQDNPDIGERFELYIAGVELGNGFSELTDPVVQRYRFEREIARTENVRLRPQLPRKFLFALADLPECAGMAIGLDRLLMLFLDRRDISTVIPCAEADL
jgi:lysyl-tRNA synthetase class 2